MLEEMEMVFTFIVYVLNLCHAIDYCSGLKAEFAFVDDLSINFFYLDVNHSKSFGLRPFREWYEPSPNLLR